MTRRLCRPAGLTLLEVILALAILGLSLAAIVQLTRIATRSASRAREMAVAQLLCQSLMDEIAAGSQTPQAVSGAALPQEPDFLYSVETAIVDQAGLLAVRITVTKAIDQSLDPLVVSLTRWIVDPSLQAAATAAEEEAAAAAAESESEATDE